MFKKLIQESMGKSPWLFHINAGSCNGCDIELVSVLTPRYDAERLGFKLTGTPRHADIVVVRRGEPWRLTASDVQSKCGWSPLEGYEFAWRVCQTVCNGEVIYDDGKFSPDSRGQQIMFR